MRRAIAAAAIALAGCGPRTDYDPDRLRKPDQMERIVAGPMRAVRAGDLAGAKRQVERLRRLRVAARPHDPYAAADVDESFGVLLVQEVDEQGELRRAALPYLARAADGVRAAKGPTHPEVAVALQTYGDALLRVGPTSRAAEARRAFCAAYRIRRVSLGPDHPETGSALAAVARSMPGTRAKAALEEYRAAPSRMEPLASIWSAVTGRDVQSDWMFEHIARDPRFVSLCKKAMR